MVFRNNPRGKGGSRTRRHGFTLIQIMLVMVIVAALAAVLAGLFSRSRAAARRAQCDTRIKAVVMALDAFRQEKGYYPDSLQQLLDDKYITDASMLRCPSDPRPNGSYDDFYVSRASHDSDELPILVCPLCENGYDVGLQAFKGRYTKQFATRPAELTVASGATIDRPGHQPIAGRAGMQVRGGDTILTVAGGQATLRFADGSTSTIGSNSEVTVLQSFIAGHSHAPLYTLLRQKAGDVVYKVHHGSKFDVTTPTATAGALGTEFRIRKDATASKWYLKVLESKVYCSVGDATRIFTPLPTDTQPGVTSNSTVNDDGTTVTETNQWVPIGTEQLLTPLATPTPAPTATPEPTATPTPEPTPTTTPVPNATPTPTPRATATPTPAPTATPTPTATPKAEDNSGNGNSGSGNSGNGNGSGGNSGSSSLTDWIKKVWQKLFG